MNLNPYFEDLLKRINPDEEMRLKREWLAFANLKLNEGYFAPTRTPTPPTIEWPSILINDALQSDTLMIYQQLYLISEALRAHSGELLNLRSNYGTGIIPSMFGAEIFMMPPKTDTLPATKSMPAGKDSILEILASGKIDFDKGFSGRVFSTARLYLEMVQPYPELKEFLHYYNPDLQGPMSLCESLWGSACFMDFYDDPDSVEAALDFLTQVYIDYTKKWHELVPPTSSEYSVEWGCLHKGHTIIRNDTAMNISGDMYEEFVLPRDQKIIAEFGGGVHFCGRGDHYIEHLANINGLSCINISQPDWNDMEKIYTNTVDKNIIIFGMHSDEVERATTEGRPLRGMVQRGASAAAWLDKKDSCWAYVNPYNIHREAIPSLSTIHC